MSLIEDLHEWYTEESYPPDGPEFGAELVHSEDLDGARWGTHFRNVYSKPLPDDPDSVELAAVEDVRPATEMQDWGDYGGPDIFPVESHVETIQRVVYTRK